MVLAGRVVTPSYQDDAVTIYHGDCREIMPTVEFDGVVVDPPYGIAYRSGHQGVVARDIKGDDSVVVRDYVLHEASRRSLPCACFAT